MSNTLIKTTCKKCHSEIKTEVCEGCKEELTRFNLPTISKKLLDDFHLKSFEVDLAKTNAVAQLMRRVISGEIILEREIIK